MDISKPPWRLGGQATLPDGADDFVELQTGTDIWAADGSPVTELSDWYSDQDLVLMAASPELLAHLEALCATVETMGLMHEPGDVRVERERARAFLIDLEKRAADRAAGK